MTTDTHSAPPTPTGLEQPRDATAGPATPTPYPQLTPEHEALVRRLHAEEIHPDYTYSRLALTGTLPETVHLAITPMFDADSPWELNEDFKPIKMNDLKKVSGGLDFQASLRMLKVKKPSV